MKYRNHNTHQSESKTVKRDVALDAVGVHISAHATLILIIFAAVWYKCGPKRKSRGVTSEKKLRKLMQIMPAVFLRQQQKQRWLANCTPVRLLVRAQDIVVTSFEHPDGVGRMITEAAYLFYCCAAVVPLFLLCCLSFLCHNACYYLVDFVRQRCERIITKPYEHIFQLTKLIGEMCLMVSICAFSTDSAFGIFVFCLRLFGFHCYGNVNCRILTYCCLAISLQQPLLHEPRSKRGYV